MTDKPEQILINFIENIMQEDEWDAGQKVLKEYRESVEKEPERIRKMNRARVSFIIKKPDKLVPDEHFIEWIKHELGIVYEMADENTLEFAIIDKQYISKLIIKAMTDDEDE